MPYTNLETFIVDRYIHGSGNSELKKHVQFRHPKALAQAIAYAAEYEAVEGPLDIPKKPSDDRVYAVVCDSITNSAEFRSQSDPINERMSRLERKLDQLLRINETQMQNKQRGPGHQIDRNDGGRRFNSPRRDDQNYRSSSPRHTNQNYRENTRISREIICSFCKGAGHIETKCPRRYNKSEN
jgi:hypothetical protein